MGAACHLGESGLVFETRDWPAERQALGQIQSQRYVVHPASAAGAQGRFHGCILVDVVKDDGHQLVPCFA